MMDYEAVLAQVLALLQQEQRIAYRVLKLRFQLDDDLLEALKDDLIYAKKLAVDEEGRVLVWTGGMSSAPSTASPMPPPATAEVSPARGEAAPVAPPPPDAERRQLTVLFCDLVDSTVLASQLDPEDLREVVRAYQDTCAKVIARFEGHIAQYLGDGLLVYFGYPLAHEDDALRAVRAGLGILEALGPLNTRLGQERGVQLAVRLGVHTGLVVVGEVGGGTRQEQLALGETPNLAARLQGIAAPNTLVISATTFQLLGGFFACQPLGTPPLKGQTQPLAVYRVLYESMARSRLEAAGSTGWTPLVGREQEIGLLRERWAQVKEGVGQMVLLSGEAGIGKSRLVQVLTEQVATEPQAWLTPCQCSPYYQNTALYPWIDLLERVALHFEREEAPAQKLSKLEGFLVQYGLPLAETVPLFAALLSFPLLAEYAPLMISPEQQKQRTLQALLTILLRIAAQQPVLFVMEDLHWVDPTTLEFLSLLVDQGPTARILVLLTFRPDFSPPWTVRSHLTQVTVHRLPRQQTAEVIRQVAHGKALPPEVVEQIVAKTDGVPLFVEELTKMVLDSDLLREREDHYELTGPLPSLAIPTTLHDSLMARLDRLATVKSLAQLGATLGREFSYELLQAVSPWDEGTVQQGLHQLVEAEFLYQRGLPPQATYLFKHALIQDAAYQSLLKSTRQQYHQQIAQVLKDHFPETVETQPELLAYHFTEAQANEQAIHYWHEAGRRTVARSAYAEAISHFKQGLGVLSRLPDTSERDHQELTLQMGLGRSLMLAKGYAAPELESVYLRAQRLCEQAGDTRRLIGASTALWCFYLFGGQLSKARTMAEQDLRMASPHTDSRHRVSIHNAIGETLTVAGELAQAQMHFEKAITLYDRHDHRLRVTGVQDYGVTCHAYLTSVLWRLGYPDRARHHSQEALSLAHEVEHPPSLAVAMNWSIMLSRDLRQVPLVLEQAASALALATDHQFAFWLAQGMVYHGWALGMQGQGEEGIAQMRQGMAVVGATWAEAERTRYPVMLAEVYGRAGQTAKGLDILAEALEQIEDNAYRLDESERYRLKGELLLQQSGDHQDNAETAFHQALAVARRQEAKALELRAALSLSRLWQQQGKQSKAQALLAPIYGWFTEGFDTADLQEAKALLETLA
jgi:predicted ATPase/class 3 adenylate cyclase